VIQSKNRMLKGEEIMWVSDVILLYLIISELTARQSDSAVQSTTSWNGPHELNSPQRGTMKIGLFLRYRIAAILAFAFLSFPLHLCAQFSPALTASALSIPAAQWLKPEAMLHLQQAKGAEKPLVLQVGSHMLFAQAHIPGSEYIGPGSQPAGILQLQNRVSALSRKKLIVLYCGCCPLNRCPNLGPAFAKLSEMGFTNVKVLYLADSFGADWADKGYPVEHGY